MNKVSLKRTYFRSVAILILSMVLVFDFRSALQPIPSLSLLNILAHERAAEYLTIGVIFDLVYFVVLILALHFVWAYLVTISCAPWFEKLKNDNQRTIFWLIIVMMHLLLILILNSYLYPTSLLSVFRNTWLATPWLIVLLSLTLLYMFYSGLLYRKQKVQLYIFSVGFLILLTPPIFMENQDREKQKPDVILIGLDGLRPDHLQYASQNNLDLMPELNRFLEQTIRYDRTYTTLARTFVAWQSLLTSQHPHQHGGRFNIPHPSLVNKNIESLKVLKGNGYNTVYALDERRFNQIDTDYGFDKVVGPKIGIADQLITGVADIPVINVLTNLSFGRYFFPFLYINRAQGKTYYPELFNNEVINQLNPETPNFLAVHLCMLHWPYTSKDFIEVDPALWENNYPHFMYASLLKSLDDQFEHLLRKLREGGYLDNAIVYVFSDHGDGFRLEQDELQSASKDEVAKLRVTSWGHGTNILDQSQARILLAYNRFVDGKPIHRPQNLKGVFSITAIMPSIFRELNLEANTMQGTPLPLNNAQLSHRQLAFVDSSIPLKSVDTSAIDETSLLYRSMDHYEVTAEGHLVMSPESYRDFISQKQRAVYYQQWQLAYLPMLEDLVIVDLENKQWQFFKTYQGNAPKRQIKRLLCKHYQSVNIPMCNNSEPLFVADPETNMAQN